MAAAQPAAVPPTLTVREPGAGDGRASSQHTPSHSLAPHAQLAAVAAHHSHCFAADRINAASRGISALAPPLPQRLRSAGVVYLSHNRLRSLNGIEQFGAVHTLSLASNVLADWAALLPLTRLPALRHLTLLGNPLARRPYYRARTLQLLRAAGVVLETLDGVAVEAGRGGNDSGDEEVLRRHTALVTVLLDQEARIAAVAHLVKRLAVHRQLLSVVHHVALPAGAAGASAARAAAAAASAGSPLPPDAAPLTLARLLG